MITIYMIDTPTFTCKMTNTSHPHNKVDFIVLLSLFSVLCLTYLLMSGLLVVKCLPFSIEEMQMLNVFWHSNPIKKFDDVYEFMKPF